MAHAADVQELSSALLSERSIASDEPMPLPFHLPLLHPLHLCYAASLHERFPQPLPHGLSHPLPHASFTVHACFAHTSFMPETASSCCFFHVVFQSTTMQWNAWCLHLLS